MRVARDDQSRDVNVLGAQRIQFGEQDGGVHHDAVADDRRDRGVQDARGHELERERFVIDDDSVSGVVATLVAHRHVHVTRHEVGQLPFTFVAPLGSDDHRCGHWAPPSRPRCKRSLLHKKCWTDLRLPRTRRSFGRVVPFGRVATRYGLSRIRRRASMNSAIVF